MIIFKGNLSPTMKKTFLYLLLLLLSYIPLSAQETESTQALFLRAGAAYGLNNSPHSGKDYDPASTFGLELGLQLPLGKQLAITGYFGYKLHYTYSYQNINGYSYSNFSRFNVKTLGLGLNYFIPVQKSWYEGWRLSGGFTYNLPGQLNLNNLLLVDYQAALGGYAEAAMAFALSEKVWIEPGLRLRILSLQATADVDEAFRPDLQELFFTAPELSVRLMRSL